MADLFLPGWEWRRKCSPPPPLSSQDDLHVHFVRPHPNSCSCLIYSELFSSFHKWKCKSWTVDVQVMTLMVGQSHEEGTEQCGERGKGNVCLIRRRGHGLWGSSIATSDKLSNGLTHDVGAPGGLQVREGRVREGERGKGNPTMSKNNSTLGQPKRERRNLSGPHTAHNLEGRQILFERILLVIHVLKVKVSYFFEFRLVIHL